MYIYNIYDLWPFYGHGFLVVEILKLKVAN